MWKDIKGKTTTFICTLMLLITALLFPIINPISVQADTVVYDASTVLNTTYTKYIEYYNSTTNKYWLCTFTNAFTLIAWNNTAGNDGYMSPQGGNYRYYTYNTTNKAWILEVESSGMIGSMIAAPNNPYAKITILHSDINIYDSNNWNGTPTYNSGYTYNPLPPDQTSFNNYIADNVTDGKIMIYSPDNGSKLNMDNNKVMIFARVKHTITTENLNDKSKFLALVVDGLTLNINGTPFNKSGYIVDGASYVANDTNYYNMYLVLNMPVGAFKLGTNTMQALLNAPYSVDLGGLFSGVTVNRKMVVSSINTYTVSKYVDSNNDGKDDITGLPINPNPPTDTVNNSDKAPVRSDYDVGILGAVEYGFDLMLYWISYPFRIIGKAIVDIATQLAQITQLSSAFNGFTAFLGGLVSFLPSEVRVLFITCFSIVCLVIVKRVLL